ncbi:MAG: N-acetyl-gamma-glutamyl-phosphate reductase [Acidobacteria bacterium]|nr:N-acetyl-gamma-glutamyl-phosphate reductase [Acidobacteriota bacterium]
MLKVSIAGGSGYAGGELIRLLLFHPEVELAQVTSERRAGSFVHSVHPNLKGATGLRFVRFDDLEPCDVLFLALPHGRSATDIDRAASLCDRLVDLSADFRLRNPGVFRQWYESEHPAPEWLDRFVYGLPELHRDALREARYASGVGCNATAVMLALLPLARAGLIERAICDLKVGSSEAGSSATSSSHHPERSGAVRSFAPAGHRHHAEVAQELGPFELHLSATAIEMVRGVACTAHVFLREAIDEREAWALFRSAYAGEPFVRIVRERSGIHRLPDPKLLAGSNFCDVGFERDPRSNRLVVISALDNLMKGAAGTAVQVMNLMTGVDETAGLSFPGLHPA